MTIKKAKRKLPLHDYSIVKATVPSDIVLFLKLMTLRFFKGFPAEEIMKFQSSLREVLLFIKYSKDKKNQAKMLKQNEERFQDMERRAADVIEVITHAGLKFKEVEGRVNVCQAIQEMREEERIKGEDRQNELTRRLLQDDRLEDLRRAVNDSDYRERLFAEYGIKDGRF